MENGIKIFGPEGRPGVIEKQRGEKPSPVPDIFLEWQQ
jgi:hypothetical protein